MVGSDHRPIVAYLEDKVPRRKGQFRFDKRWIGQEDLMDSIETGWSQYNDACRILLQKFAIAVTKLLNGERTTHHLEKKKLVIFKRYLRRFRHIIIGLRRIF